MIGHYLLTLTEEQEDRVLTRSFGGRREPCLCMLVGAGFWGAQQGEFMRRDVPGQAYEEAIAKFGVARINAAIRNRILSNRARRILADVPVLARSAEEPR